MPHHAFIAITFSLLLTFLFVASYPPECEKYEAVHRTSERTGVDQCFEVTVNCNDPVNSEKLTFKDLTGNGTQHFTLNSDSTTNDKVSFCTLGSLQGNVGQWHVSVYLSLIIWG